ncbi:hydrogenase maturation protease [Mycobacterium sp. IDR2000157661]|uniref:hydrogenase maturation protease n=1 Tax=Mycobacterium sp. IDR2000157661 TaxID=2867005 RepID=UPI001EEA6E2A|nr:hydrogenase maturation protease [Mycobacterium sp. IDR2000157661]ULE33401.1 hydrogenase maturation protease [Mycobacterium sp. IDR2000157661]
MTAGVVIGVGNSFRRDDGVGLAVAAEVARRRIPDVLVIEATGEPGALLDAWSGVGLAVVVDAAMGNGVSPGRIRRWTPDENTSTGQVSSHAIGIPQAFELGEALGQLPNRLVVVSIGIADASQGPGLSPAVAAAVPTAVDAVLAELGS